MSEYLTGQCADTIGYSMYTGKSQHGEAARNAFSLHQLLLIFQLRDPSLVYKRLTGYNSEVLCCHFTIAFVSTLQVPRRRKKLYKLTCRPRLQCTSSSSSLITPIHFP